jgi:hypothetical protein
MSLQRDLENLNRRPQSICGSTWKLPPLLARHPLCGTTLILMWRYSTFSTLGFIDIIAHPPHYWNSHDRSYPLLAAIRIDNNWIMAIDGPTE